MCQSIFYTQSMVSFAKTFARASGNAIFNSAKVSGLGALIFATGLWTVECGSLIDRIVATLNFSPASSRAASAVVKTAVIATAMRACISSLQANQTNVHSKAIDLLIATTLITGPIAIMAADRRKLSLDHLVEQCVETLETALAAEPAKISARKPDVLYWKDLKNQYLIASIAAAIGLCLSSFRKESSSSFSQITESAVGAAFLSGPIATIAISAIGVGLNSLHVLINQHQNKTSNKMQQKRRVIETGGVVLTTVCAAAITFAGMMAVLRGPSPNT